MQSAVVWPRAGVRGQDLVVRLQDVLNRLNTMTVGPDAIGGAYLDWATDALMRLQPAVSPADLQRLVQTPTFFATVNASPLSVGANRVLLQEMDGRRAALQAALDGTESAVRRWNGGAAAHLVIPDTNVLLHHEAGVTEVDWQDLLGDRFQPADGVRLVVPLLVVDELEKRKDGKDPQRSRARQVLKLFYESFARQPDVRRDLSVNSAGGMTSLELLMEDPSHVRLPRADDELINTAAQLQNFVGRPVHFLTYDTGAALRAGAAGVAQKLL